MPQQFIETVLELNGLNFKDIDLVIQSLIGTMKLQLSGKRNDYTPYGDLLFRAKKYSSQDYLLIQYSSHDYFFIQTLRL